MHRNQLLISIVSKISFLSFLQRILFLLQPKHALLITRVITGKTNRIIEFYELTCPCSKEYAVAVAKLDCWNLAHIQLLFWIYFRRETKLTHSIFKIKKASSDEKGKKRMVIWRMFCAAKEWSLLPAEVRKNWNWFTRFTLILGKSAINLLEIHYIIVTDSVVI